MKRYGFTLLTLVFLGVSLACGGGGGEGDGSTDAGLAAGFPHSLVLYSDGSVYAWGWNDEGQLGLGDDVERDTPTLVGALSDKGVISITAGSDHSLVLCSDGSVYAWGDNNSGQLGLGDELDRDFPTLVSTLSDKDVISLAGGFAHSLALCSDGSVYTWGKNDDGQLGLGDDVDRDIPTLVGALSDKDVISLTAGTDYSFARCSDGSVYAWGDNDEGQLGLGDEVNRDIPTLVGALSDKDVTSLNAGSAHSLALCSDGSVYAWGWNGYGQLGLGDEVDRDTPTLVGALSDKDVISLAGGYGHSLALCSDGSVYTCGANDRSQLGLGDDVHRNTPTLVGTLSDKDVISLTTGRFHSLALCSDDSVYAWGYNGYGQLGLGDYVNRDIPTLVTFP